MLLACIVIGQCLHTKASCEIILTLRGADEIWHLVQSMRGVMLPSGLVTKCLERDSDVMEVKETAGVLGRQSRSRWPCQCIYHQASRPTRWCHRGLALPAFEHHNYIYVFRLMIQISYRSFPLSSYTLLSPLTFLYRSPFYARSHTRTGRW